MTSTVAEQKFIRVMSGAASQMATVTFVAGPADGGTSSLVANPATVAADGIAASMLTVIARDAFGNPVCNQNVTVSASGTNNTFSPIVGTTDQNGIFVSALSSTTLQTETVSANLQGASMNANVSFVVGPANLTYSSLTLTPHTSVADGSSKIVARATIQDGGEHALVGASVTFASTGSDAFTANPVLTNGAGVASTSISSTLPGTRMISASIGPLSLDANAAFDPVPPKNLSVKGLTGGRSATISNAIVTALDSNGNAVSTYTGAVTFTSSDAQAILPSVYTFTTANAGIATFSNGITFFAVGSQTVTATDIAVSTITGTSQAVSITAPDLAYFALTGPSANANCLQVPNWINASGTQLIDFFCTYNINQIFALGTDMALRSMQMCVGVQGGSLTAGQNVILEPCSAKPTQRWTLNSNAVISVVNPNICFSRNASAAIVLAPCSATAAQLVIPRSTTRNFLLTNARSYTAGTVTSAHSAGQALTYNRINYTPTTQQFELMPNGQVMMAMSDGLWCVDNGNTLSAGTALTLQACASTPGTSQAWTILPSGYLNQGISIAATGSPSYHWDGVSGTGNVVLMANANTSAGSLSAASGAHYYEVASVASPTQCLTMVAGAASGTGVTMQPCANNNTQYFRIEPDSSGTGINFYAPFASTVLQVPGGNYTTNQVLQMLTGGSNIEFMPILGTYAYGTQFLADATAYGLAIDVGTAANGTPAILQTWSSTALTQTFIMRPHSFTFASATVPTLCIAAQSFPSAGVPLVYQTCANQPLQTFGTNQGDVLVVGGSCLDALGGVASGSITVTNTCTGVSTQMWRLTSTGQIQSMSNSAFCLDATEAALNNNLVITACAAAGMFVTP